MGCGLTWVDSALNRGFYRLGLLVGRRPGYFIVVPILLSGLFATGYQRMRYEIDPEYLFSPVNGEGKAERAIVEQYFKPNYTSRFNVGRITRPGRFGRVIVTPREGHDMLRQEIWAELRQLDALIQNATVHWEDGETFTYREVCARWEDQCFHNDILELDHVLADVETRRLNLTFPIMFNPVTWHAHAFPVFFGGTVVSDEGTIISVPSVQLVYFVTADTKRQDARGAAWEDVFLDVVGEADAHTFKHISVARFASRTLDIELERNTRTVIPYFSTTFIIMAFFSITSCMMADWVRSKPWLGFLGNISAVMGTGAAFGLVMYLGVEFIGINLAAPFLMLGIGIDDTFVMLAAWRRTPVTLTVPERMARTLSEAAVSITITSFTDMISFWIGIISPFPSVRIFCIYTGFAVCFTFLWHITFFAGCMALSGYVEQRNLHSFTCMRVLPVSKSDKKPRWYRWLCSGGIDPAAPDDPRDNGEHACMAFFRDHAAALLNRRSVKAVVLVVFAAYLAGACYGITTMEEGLERRKLSRADSYSVEFYDREDFYFREFPYRIQVVITGNLNYSDRAVQDEIENLTQTFENTTFISSPLYTESWLRSFVGYIRRNEDYLNVSIDTEEDFINTLKELWLFKPNPFSLDVKFNDEGTRIIASRFLIQAVNISTSNDEKAMVRALRKICHESPLNVSVFHPYFVFFDQFELVRPTSIQSMIIGASIMMLVCFIFIPNALCSLWVAFSIISIEAGVAGYMALWSVRLDSISMINLIMCIGFSVDFTAHICYAYMSSKATNPQERVRECLYALGLPIIQGASSTILAVISLLLAGSYIFLVFFKMVFLVIFFGAMHGLFLLPVLLSIFGPGSCTRKKKEEDGEAPVETHLSAVEKAFPHPYCIPHPSLQPAHQNGYPFRKANGDAGVTPQPLFLGGSAGTPFHHHFGVPLSGLSPYSGGKYTDGNGGGVEKDLGLGTSGEDSSESSSSKSQRRLQKKTTAAEEDDEEEAAQRRRYQEGWRKSSASLEVFRRIPEAYNNSGYVSDEEGRGRPRHGQDGDAPRGRARPRDDAHIPRRYTVHETNGAHAHSRPRSRSQHSPRTGHQYQVHSRGSPGYHGDHKFR
ncbi:patched domain-containing protein 3 [Schistocerca americana]|uniref:patched domain-containing protein 3 n=1 Tax=Schistocerca americana TaxID=7009 RepID=UPI001F4FC78D|nr:patched domain-containing protein 3 [Schistocerca americana]